MGQLWILLFSVYQVGLLPALVPEEQQERVDLVWTEPLAERKDY